jgi:uncharacterized protein
VVAWIVFIVVLFQVLLLAGFYIFQYKFLFISSSLPENFKFSFQAPFEEAFIPSGKANIHGLYFKSEKRRGLVIYFHGNADNLAQWGELSGDFTAKGFDLLMVDYPTFGKSTGRLGQKQLVRMGFDVYDYCKQFYPESKLVLYGRSMGSGLASHVAAQRSPGLVILETPYVDIKTLVNYHAPKYTPTSLILSLSLSNKACIPAIKCPILLLHGTDDDIIPYQQAIELSKILAEKDKLITFNGGDHRNLGQYDLYHWELQKALDSVS